MLFLMTQPLPNYHFVFAYWRAFSDVDSGAKRSVVVCVCKCNVPARKEEIMDLPPSFDPACLENRVNMSLLMPLPTFAAASALVEFVILKPFDSGDQ